MSHVRSQPDRRMKTVVPSGLRPILYQPCIPAFSIAKSCRVIWNIRRSWLPGGVAAVAPLPSPRYTLAGWRFASIFVQVYERILPIWQVGKTGSGSKTVAERRIQGCGGGDGARPGTQDRR